MIGKQSPTWAERALKHQKAMGKLMARRIRTTWPPIHLPKHKKQNLAQLVFKDLRYFYWFVTSGESSGIKSKKNSPEDKVRIHHQAKLICHLLRRIRPPQGKRKGYEFAIMVDGDGVFERFIVSKKSARTVMKLANGSKIVARTDVLDAFVPVEFKNPKLGCERMARYMRREFFRDTIGKPGEAHYRGFLATLDNFSVVFLGVRLDHFNKYMRVGYRPPVEDGDEISF